MPSLGADMESGVLVEWLVGPGQRVKRGQIVAVVETQKGAVEVEIWDDGEIDELKVAPGTEVPVGELLATLRPSGVQPVAAPRAAAAPGPVLTPASPRRGCPPPASAHCGFAGRTPLAETVDLCRCRRNEPCEDAERCLGASPPARETRAGVPGGCFAAMRHAIAAAMARSKREIPHYYLGTQINVERALVLLAQENAARSVKERVLFAAVLLKAVATALKEVPELNGFWADGGFKPSEAVHVGVGIALRGGGLIAPAIRDADRKSVPEMMTALGDLIQRVRAVAQLGDRCHSCVTNARPAETARRDYQPRWR
jgi:pyruvate dehydrogenase E2 component (dihydrolipoamide acetyltransferase)